LLAQQVVAQYPGKAHFVSENFGESKLAERFGIKRYPAVFVDDVLIATPRDFGFFGEGENAGRYTPWRDARNHEKFKQDLARMIDLILQGKKSEIASQSADASHEVASLPEFSLTDLAGRPLSAKDVEGRVVVVEFWATWCPPCRSTLEWLGELRGKYGDKIAVVALAVDSPDGAVRKLTGGLSQEIHWAVATPEVGRAFGDVVAVPTMFVFDRQGKTAANWFGAPPDLHANAESILNAVLNEVRQ